MGRTRIFHPPNLSIHNPPIPQLLPKVPTKASEAVKEAELEEVADAEVADAEVADGGSKKGAAKMPRLFASELKSLHRFLNTKPHILKRYLR